MKKIISLGIASAVLAMTAISASAAVTALPVDEIVPGETVTVAFYLSGETDTSVGSRTGVNFTVETEGLEYVSDTSKEVTGWYGTFSVKDDTATYNGANLYAASEPGFCFLTVTYTVTAGEGEAVSVNITSSSGNVLGEDAGFYYEIEPEDPGTDDPGTDDPGTDDPGTDDPGTDDPGTDDPGTDDPGTDDPGTDDPGTDDPGTDDPGKDPGKDPEDDPTKNPGTGVALAVFPAVIAGAAVVVAKKKRS